MASAVKVNSEDVGMGETIVSTVTMSNSYTTDGEALTAQDLGFRVGERLDLVALGGASGYVLEWVPDATYPDRGKVKVYEEADSAGAMAEVGNGTDLATVTFRAVAFGR